MRRISSPFDRFPGEVFAIAVGVTILLTFLVGPWAALIVTSLTAAGQAFLIRRAYSARDIALHREATTAERDVVLRSELQKIRSRMPYEDPETGLGTRRQLEVSWTRQLARHRRWGEPFSISVLEVTDAFGKDRLLGPSVAATVAQSLLEVARTEDVVCRLDNHTFAVLLAGASEEGARAFIDRVRVKVSAKPHDVDGTEVYFSAVGGVVEWDETMPTALDMLKVADADLTKFRTDHRREMRAYAGDLPKAS